MSKYLCITPHVFLRYDVLFGRKAMNVTIPRPVTRVRTRGPGAPRKVIDASVLHEAFESGRRIPFTKLSKALGVDRKTLRRRMKDLNIETGFSEVTDDELDVLLQDYLRENPVAGRSYVMGHLRSHHNLRIQFHRVIASMDRVNRLAQGMRKQIAKKKEHSPYHVPRPNHLWHIDGHHKLIAWGIVLHGVADGYSRKVTIQNALCITLHKMINFNRSLVYVLAPATQQHRS